jgi:undecaprenyl-diphosphatase
MNEFIIALIQGIVEGFTEFLPISSTGHLIVLNRLLGFEGEFAKTFDIFIQLGAILAVVFYFRSKINPFSKKKSAEEKIRTIELWKKIIVGVIPILILGAILGDYLEEKLFSPFVVAAALIVGGIILLIIESKKHESTESIKSLSYKTAILIGLIQCLAMIPGTSRSAATIIGAMLLGLSRIDATEFSFYLAIPTMLAASGYALLSGIGGLDTVQAMMLTTGFISAFFVALAVIAGFMRYISERDFKPFGYYRIILGIAIIIYFAVLL